MNETVNLMRVRTLFQPEAHNMIVGSLPQTPGLGLDKKITWILTIPILHRILTGSKKRNAGCIW